jgi:hypothetical protein
MNPLTQRLTAPPRSLLSGAFFEDDRSTTAQPVSVPLVELDQQGADRTNVPPVPTTFAGFKNRHVVGTFSAPNPLPQRRATRPNGPIDTALAGWTHKVAYTYFFTRAARALGIAAAGSPRLRVTLLFGTGTEYFRHGVCAAVDAAAAPTLLIDVPGIEPRYVIKFQNPSNPRETRELMAFNRWGVGITTASIEEIIERRYGRVINYDVTICAAFSTGYLGLQGSIGSTLFTLDRLDRVVIFDCLYGSLKPVLDRVKALKGSLSILVYVVTEGGNSFRNNEPASFRSLLLGGIPSWRYINLMGNVAYHAVASARVVHEARSASALIIDPLPGPYEAALNALVTRLPARNTLISNATVARVERGSVPVAGPALDTFATDSANRKAIADFFKQVVITRSCIRRAQLLGWPAPVGEEWHDMLLIEFAWEYLT